MMTTYCFFCQTTGHTVVDCDNIDQAQLDAELAAREQSKPDRRHCPDASRDHAAGECPGTPQVYHQRLDAPGVYSDPLWLCPSCWLSDDRRV